MRTGMSFLIFFFLSASPLAAGPQGSTPPPKYKCPVCGMFVAMFADWNARVESKDSTVAFFDGAKCMFKYYLDMKKYNPSKTQGDVTVISVKDYYSKTSIDALQAFFVI
jgi:copper chaperone NosL